MDSAADEKTPTITIPLKEYQLLLRKAEDLELLQSCSFHDEVDPWVIRCAHPDCKARAITDGNRPDVCYDCEKMLMCCDQRTCTGEYGDTHYCDQHAPLYLIEIKYNGHGLMICRGCNERGDPEQSKDAR